uniref:Fc receptor-like protein 5 n=1 Tax=Semicossyphus pulcher TaxID=241346 RepID=UPI0037E7418B
MLRQSVADMEVRTLSIRLLIHVLFLRCARGQEVDSVFLRAEPNRLQFFEYEPLTLVCVDSHGSTGWRIVHHIKGELTSCETTTTTSSCRVRNAFTEDSGVYWCESGGKRSNNMDIIVTAGPVILESPVAVMEGDSVTLRCRNKKPSSSRSADFYKDGLLIRSSSAGEMTIHGVSKFDRGFYKCKVSGGGESAQSWLAVSWLAVREKHGETTSSSSTPWIVVTVLLALLLVVGLLHHTRGCCHRGTETVNYFDA